jgi:putative ABC transport system permease protein
VIKLSLQNTWAHKRRLVGTFLAVLIGVSFLSGTLVLGDTLRDNFDKLFKAGYAGIDVVVRPERPADGSDDDTGFSAKTIDALLADTIRDIDGVRAVAAQTTGFAQVIGADGERIGGSGPPTLAANWDPDDGLNPYNLVKGRAPDGPEEVILDDETVETGKLKLNGTATLLMPTPLEVTIVGIAEFGDGSSKVGVTYAFFSESGTAAHLTREPGQVNQIAVAAERGVTEEELLKRIEPVIGSGNEALTGTAAADEAVSDINADFLGFITTFLVVFAGIALFVATFSIYNTFSIIVAQRSRESALMRAIGATRGQVLQSTMVEALVIGVLASVVGLFGGIGVAALLKAAFDAFGLALPAGGLTIKTSGIVIAIVVGVVVTLGAAIVPARRGSRVRPIEALRASALESEVPRTRRTVIGVVLAIVGVGVLLWSVLAEPDNMINYAGPAAFVILVAMLVLGPVVARPVAGLLGAPIAKAGGITGELSRDNAIRNPRRTASTAAALLVGVAIVVLFSVFIASLKSLITDSVERTFGGDLVVANAGFGIPTLPPELAGQIAGIDGVKSAIGYGVAQVGVDGEDPDFYGAVDVPELAKVLDLDIVEGSAADFGDQDVGISEETAKDNRLSVGDSLDLSFADGTKEQGTVAMVYRNADIVGSDLFSRAGTTPHETIKADAVVFVTLDEGASAAQARKDIKQFTDPIGKPKIQDKQEYTDSVAANLDALLGIIIVMLALAIIIAAMGIANTIALSVHERTRELGLLRAVGTTRTQLRRMVRWEAVIVSTFGTIGGVGLGIGLGWALTRAVLADSASSPFALPVSTLVIILIAGLVIGVLAAWRPSYRAAKMDVLEAVSEA